jgi:hypothetical protein
MEPISKFQQSLPDGGIELSFVLTSQDLRQNPSTSSSAGVAEYAFIYSFNCSARDILSRLNTNSMGLWVVRLKNNTLYMQHFKKKTRLSDVRM